MNISHKYHDAKHNFSDLGIETTEVKFDLGKMMNKKTKVVDSLTKGIEMLFKKNKVDYVKGLGKFQDANTMLVEQLDGSTKTVKSKNYIIATGSEPNNLPGGILPVDENRVVSSTGNLFFLCFLIFYFKYIE